MLAAQHSVKLDELGTTALRGNPAMQQLSLLISLRHERINLQGCRKPQANRRMRIVECYMEDRCVMRAGMVRIHFCLLREDAESSGRLRRKQHHHRCEETIDR